MKNILARIKARGEEGLALASSVMLPMFVFLIVMSVGMTIALSAEVTASTKAQAQRINDAESGTARALVETAAHKCKESFGSREMNYRAEIYRSAEGVAPTSLDDPGVVKGCPQEGDKYLIIKSTGTDKKGKKTVTVSVYEWMNTPAGSVDTTVMIGKLTAGSEKHWRILPSLNDPRNRIVILDGDLRCDSNVGVNSYAQLILKSGNTTYEEGRCNHNGDIFVGGNFTFETIPRYIYQDEAGRWWAVDSADRINGNIYALGKVKGKGDFLVNGTIHGKDVDLSEHTGAPLNVVTDFETPLELTDQKDTWIEYEYDADEWRTAGWHTELMNSSQCDLTQNAPLVTKIRTARKPTVFDFSACERVNAQGLTLHVSGNTAFIGNSFNFLDTRITRWKQETVGSGFDFYLITPDQINDGAPTCSPGQGSIDTRNFNVGTGLDENNVAGGMFVYTPCVFNTDTTGETLMPGQLIVGEYNPSGAERGINPRHKTFLVPGIEAIGQASLGYVSSSDSKILPNLVYREEL